MSDRRTFLGNAAAAAVIAKISPLRSFEFTSDGPQTIHPTMSDREKAGLRGSVKQCTEETIIPGVQGGPEIRSSQTTEYDPDGRILSSSIGTDGSKWATTNIYDDNGRLTKTSSGNATEPGPETLYSYDEAGRLLSITKSGKEGGSKSDFHYDEQGRKTAVQHFDPETLKRAQSTAYSGSPWDAAVEVGMNVPMGGNITTVYDANDQPTEAQIRDGEGRIVTRFVRTYDANGRILEEKQIQENPALLMADKLDPDGQPHFNAAQLEAMNRVMRSMLSGRSGTGITYAYDAQGRVTEMRDRNSWFDKATTISYNEQGDVTAQREIMTSNSIGPVDMAFSMDENGTITPERRSAEPTESPGPDLGNLAGENEVRYAYEYDSYGNWTQQTENRSYGPDKPSYVHVRHRKLTYY